MAAEMLDDQQLGAVASGENADHRSGNASLGN